VFAGILVVYSLRTIIRNPNWHDQVTLYAHDVEHLTESAKANALYSNILYPIVAKEIATNPGNPKNKENINKIIFHYKEALRIDSNYLTTINNLGSAYMNFHKDYDKTIYYCQKAVDMDEEYMEAHFNLAYSYDVKGNYKKAMYHYSRVIEINPEYMKAYESFNVVVNKYKKVKEGIDLLKKSAEKVDRPKNIYLDIGNLYSLDNYNVQQSIVYFIKAFELDKSDKKLCFHIATLYNSIGDKDKADFYFSLCGA
jgi:tetratricopeptide (TPR) repeat protein